jgi:multidrug efflux pump subunit AcrA (membrane-fusion protein)
MSKLDLGKVSAETSLKIQEAEARLAQSFEKLAEINSKVYKMDIDIANLSSRIDQRTIYAPADGQITRLRVLGSAETIKTGTELATIVPDSTDQAIEIFISDYFAPLVSVGRPVRIQIAGWPGLQFSGWPSIAIGTFAGEVAVIDAVSDDKNQYRLLIKPDHKRIKKGLDQAWPGTDVLRPGTKAIGWVILDEVPLWYELWRVLNGFPPTIMEAPTKNKVKGIK